MLIRILLVIYYFIGFAFGLSMMVICIITQEAISGAFEDIQYIFENWDATPFESIWISDNCDQNKVDILNIYHWPGTVAGCYCRNVNAGNDQAYYEINPILNEACNKTHYAIGCSDIQSLDERNFSKFTLNQEQASFSICGKRMKNISFYRNFSRTEKCPEGTKRCDIATTNNLICFETCPVSEFTFQSNERKNVGQTESQDINGYQFVIKRGTQPLVDVKVSEDGVCLRNKVPSITKNRIDYVLMRKQKIDCKRDPRFRLTLLTDEEIFFKINNSSDLGLKLPEYEINAKYKWGNGFLKLGIYQRNYIQWKFECNIYLEPFKSQSDHYHSLNETQLYMMVLAILLFCVAFFLLQIALIILIFTLKFSLSFIFTQIFQFSVKISLVALLWFIITESKAHTSENYNQLLILHKEQCSDDITNGIITTFIDTLKKCTSLNQNVLILCIVICSLDAFIVGSFLATMGIRFLRDCFGEEQNATPKKFSKKVEQFQPIQQMSRNEAEKKDTLPQFDQNW